MTLARIFPAHGYESRMSYPISFLKKIYWITLFLCFTQLAWPTTYPLKIKDSVGREVTIPHRPQRIVTLDPSLTEIVFALGQGNLIIGNTDFCIYPEASKHIPKIGGIVNPNLEKIRQLNPDIVLALTDNTEPAVHAIEGFNYPIVVLHHTNLKGVLEDITRIGLILDCQKTADVLVKKITSRLLKLTQSDQLSIKPKTLLLYGLESYMSAGKNTFAADVLRLAGCQNLTDKISTDWPVLSMEQIIQWNPDWLVISPMEENPNLTKKYVENLKKNILWSKIKAIKLHHVIILPFGEISVPGPRLVDAAEIISKEIHAGNHP
jgi:iron complex transport system substrate-binding protein